MFHDFSDFSCVFEIIDLKIEHDYGPKILALTSLCIQELSGLNLAVNASFLVLK